MAPEWSGSTSNILEVDRHTVVKQPIKVWEGSSSYEKLTNKIQNCFTVEQLILKRLGNHPRIVKYHGWQDEPQRLRGLILSRASHGNLQQYLELNYEAIDMCTKQQWCRQAVEAVAYIHSQGVWHSDLRPDNYLVHATTPTSLDLWLCDFGGSVCKELRLDGKQLPDPGFFDPNAEWVASVATDIFSLGSILYSIVTGHWPYRRLGPFVSNEEMLSYDEWAEGQFRRRIYPDVNGVYAGSIILGCWTRKYANAEDILQTLDVASNSWRSHVL